MNDFVRDLVLIDRNAVDQHRAETLCEDFIKYAMANESRIVEFYSKVLTFFTCFLSIISFLFYMDRRTLFFVAYVIVVLHAIIPFFMLVKHIFSASKVDFFMKSFTKSLLNSIRGIQFFGVKDVVFERLNNDIKKTMTNEYSSFRKAVWKLFITLCIIFMTLCLSYYITDLDYSKEVLQATNKYIIPCVSAVFLYILFLRSLLKFKKTTNNNVYTIDSYLINNNKTRLTKIPSEKDLIIAFHGASLNDTSSKSDHPVLHELTFSVLPREIISIVGENAYKYGNYIYDILLGFYTIQSGNVYISGTNINNIDTDNLHRRFFVFKEDFGLINGNVQDNILYALDNTYMTDIRKFTNIIENLGISKYLEENVFDEYGDIAVPQNMLVKIQLARAFLIDCTESRSYDAILIEPPSYFSDPETEKLFYEIVNISFQKKTILVITDRPPVIIRSNKILYLGHNKNIFGTHADLITDKDYQNFISNRL